MRGEQFSHLQLNSICAGYREVPQLWMAATSGSRAGSGSDVAYDVDQHLGSCDLEPLVREEAISKMVNFF